MIAEIKRLSTLTGALSFFHILDNLLIEEANCMSTRTKKIIRDYCIGFGIGLAGGSIYESIKLGILKRKT